MARLHTVKKSRKAQGPCGKCGETIGVGETYLWWKFKRGGLHRRCHRAECRPRYSDYGTSSHHLQALYSAQENYNDEFSKIDMNPTQECLDAVAAAMNSMAEAVREVSEGYKESAENMVEGFGHETYQSEEIAEKAENLESWADEIESAASELESITLPDEEDEDELEQFDIEQEMEQYTSITEDNPL